MGKMVSELLATEDLSVFVINQPCWMFNLLLWFNSFVGPASLSPKPDFYTPVLDLTSDVSSTRRWFRMQMNLFMILVIVSPINRLEGKSEAYFILLKQALSFKLTWWELILFYCDLVCLESLCSGPSTWIHVSWQDSPFLAARNVNLLNTALQLLIISTGALLHNIAWFEAEISHFISLQNRLWCGSYVLSWQHVYLLNLWWVSNGKLIWCMNFRT